MYVYVLTMGLAVHLFFFCYDFENNNIETVPPDSGMMTLVRFGSRKAPKRALFPSTHCTSDV